MKNVTTSLNFSAVIGQKLSLSEEVKELKAVLKARDYADKWHAVYCICEELNRRNIKKVVKQAGFLNRSEVIEEMKKIQDEKGATAAQATQGEKGDYYIKTQQKGFVGYINLKHIRPGGGFENYTDQIVEMAYQALKNVEKSE